MGLGETTVVLVVPNFIELTFTYKQLSGNMDEPVQRYIRLFFILLSLTPFCPSSIMVIKNFFPMFITESAN